MCFARATCAIVSHNLKMHLIARMAGARVNIGRILLNRYSSDFSKLFNANNDKKNSSRFSTCSVMWQGNVSRTNIPIANLDLVQILPNIQIEELQKRSSILNISKEDHRIPIDEGYLTVLQASVSDLQKRNLPEIAQWIEKVFDYNVPHGKGNRITMLEKAFQGIIPEEERTAESRYLCKVLAWCIQTVQGYFTVGDDILDNSITRRGRPCWYRIENVGSQAALDIGLLHDSVFNALKHAFGNQPYYSDLLECFHQIIFFSMGGELVDILSTPVGRRPAFHKFSNELFENIAHHKTGYYTFVFPVKTAFIMAGKKEKYSKKLEKWLLDISYFYQAQDDIIDCFGDPKETGKIGTDIEEGKIAWPIIQALQLANSEQRAIIKSNYGIPDEKCQRKIKDVYLDLGIPERFEQYESDTRKKLIDDISSFSSDIGDSEIFFKNLIEGLFKRKR